MLMNNRYELIKTLEGVSSQIFYAEDQVTRRQVIIKAKTYQGKGSSIEKEILQAVQHEHLLDLLDVFIEGETQYLVLSYFEGRTLAQYIADRNLTEETIVDYFGQLCGVVSYLHKHSMGIVHCDITPSNILINSRDHLKLIDFDASHCLSFCKEEIGEYSYGTIGYAAPENILYPEISGYQCDLYGLGVCLKSCLKSIAPFYSLELALIAKKGSALHPKERYRGIDEMEQDIQLLL